MHAPRDNHVRGEEAAAFREVAAGTGKVPLLLHIKYFLVFYDASGFGKVRNCQLVALNNNNNGRRKQHTLQAEAAALVPQREKKLGRTRLAR
jgi:hypothetical protein